MKFETKMIILSCCLAFLFIVTFTYISRIGQKNYYVYQVGIYKEEKNKNSKIDELKKDGYESYFYKKDNQFYVLSMISEDYEKVQQHSLKVKGIIKKYVVSYDTTVESLLKKLSKEEEND